MNSAVGYRTNRQVARRRERVAERRQLRQRALLLVAVVGIPVAAAQGAWPGLARAIGVDEGSRPAQPMPFEIAGQSFPGSAFFYLDEPPQLAFDIKELRVEEGEIDAAKYTEEYGAGAAAKAFRSAGTGLDKARALQCLSLAVYYEAASESQAGQEAVAQVVLNRVAHPAYPNSICGVVFQGSERKTGCQFTFTCDGAMARRPSRSGWARAQSVALAALAGRVYSPVGLATHYHTHAVNPYWASSLAYIGSIGAHRFYRWKGNAGQAAAFTNIYTGGERLSIPDTPQTVPTPGVGVTPAVPPPNSVIGVGDDTGNVVGSAPGSPAGARDPVGPPKSGDVKPEFENSGRWLKQPGAQKPAQ